MLEVLQREAHRAGRLDQERSPVLGTDDTAYDLSVLKEENRGQAADTTVLGASVVDA